MKLNFQLLQSCLSPVPDNHQSKDWSGHAAVLVPLIDDGKQTSLLLTRRAIHMTHHGGEVAFPGGMWEFGDHFPHITALREAEEEVALSPECVTLLGTLPAMPTRNKTQVTPVIGTIKTNLPLVPSPDEIDSIFYVPLSELHPDKRVRTDIFSGRGHPVWAPAYDFQGYEIWGFTAGVIKVLLEKCLDFHFPREHHAPEKFW